MGAPGAAEPGSAGIETTRIVVLEMPSDPGGAHRVTSSFARAFGLPLAAASALLARLPARAPFSSSEDASARLVAELEAAGAVVGTESRPAMTGTCSRHEGFFVDGACARCDAALCGVCLASSDRCEKCARAEGRRRAFTAVRIAVLSAILVVVVLYASKDRWSRASRTDWTRTLTVGLVLVRAGPVDDAAIAALRERVRVLEEVLYEDFRRHRPAGDRPFRFVLYGPVDGPRPPPLPDDSGLAAAKHTWQRWRYQRSIDEAASVETAGLDARVYVVLRAPTRSQSQLVEGFGEQGGRVGIVEVDIDVTMVDFALAVAAHELFHTLGATDKYDGAGKALRPDGLAEPELRPLVPQRYAEIMARGRPISETEERPPENLEELRVGPATAREIHWVVE